MIRFPRRQFLSTMPVAALASQKASELVKPRALRPGDTVGLITPSTYVSDPDRLWLAQWTIEQLGLRCRMGRNVGRREGYLAGTVRERVEDLHAMFADPEVKAVFCVRGGYGAAMLLDSIDYGLIRRNPKIFLGYSDITALHLAIHRLARLVTNLSLLAESRLAGTTPAAFHLTNIAIHLLNGFLVWRILEELLARHGERSAGDRMAALAGAGLYLLHPLQTEAVAYISSRSEVLCAMFAYLAFRVFLGSSPDQPMTWRRASAATVLIGLSALSKEPGVAMAGVFVVYDLVFSEKPRLRPLLQRWRLYAPLLAAAAIIGTKLFLTLSREGTAGVSARHKPLDYLLTQFEVIWRYLRLVILPFGQNLDHAYPVAGWPGTVWTWASLLALGMLAAAFWRLRPRYPVAFFGFAFLLILLAPTSSIVPIDDAMAARMARTEGGKTAPRWGAEVLLLTIVMLRSLFQFGLVADAGLLGLRQSLVVVGVGDSLDLPFGGEKRDELLARSGAGDLARLSAAGGEGVAADDGVAPAAFIREQEQVGAVVEPHLVGDHPAQRLVGEGEISVRPPGGNTPVFGGDLFQDILPRHQNGLVRRRSLGLGRCGLVA